MKRISPTPYPDVNEILERLLRDIRRILDDHFVGMYLYGSLSSGDFNPTTSDIDFLVITADYLPWEQIAGLAIVHKQIQDSGLEWASRLEGAYVPRGTIRRHEPAGARYPTVNEGRYYLGALGSDWIIQRHIVREYGIIVEGPDPKTLIDFVGSDDIRRAVRGVLDEWWFPLLEDHSWLRRHGSEYHSFAVITMCRALHALEHGRIVSKPAAVAWARQHLGSEWTDLLDKAAVSDHGESEGFLDGTLSLIRFVKRLVSRRE